MSFRDFFGSFGKVGMSIMEGNEFDKLDDAAAFICVQEMIDKAGDTQDEVLNNTALGLSEHLSKRVSLSGEQRALLHYFRANAFENRLEFSGMEQSWDWDIPHLQSALLELRSAVGHEAFSGVDPFRQCQIYTNLANKLSSVGRPVEAIVYWDRAIAINPGFAMALGNRGAGLRYYGMSLYDRGHSGFLLLSAYDSLSVASGDQAIFDCPHNLSHKSRFSTMAGKIAEAMDLDKVREVLTREFSLGRSKLERAYRSWCLENRLFLNPLNDIGGYSVSAHDVLHLPSLITDIGEGGAEPPAAFGLFNQLKQEFVSARWLCYEGLSEQRGHFSDKDTHLYDTLNIPSYSLGTEKTKLAFRMAYSLFDKIAFFINDYFKVGLREKDVSFRRVWYERKGEEPKPLSHVFTDLQNWPLRGLYWLSKDLYEPSFHEVSEPDAEGIAELRNYLEHKYCQVFEDIGLNYSRFATSQRGPILGLRIGRDELERKSLHILKLARAALIYLSLAVYWEEKNRNSGISDKQVASMPLWKWELRGRL